ncbi:redoxin domain-containing protein [Alkalicaulis satelles]|uniref:Redoxin domain-containing protein n=1 Tax=Alkalicaulis satelles TaxID=2609175 RepID=A0A5M6ZF43_9PROT|nr:redoxin family protein [Alkalicaulis satelles]KAA5803363.1 redoxin domain-containing protein [Alkalicaulis satelles]
MKTASLNRRNLILGTSLLAASALTLSVFAGGASADPFPGNPAPAFTGLTATGESVSLSDFSGQTVILEWTNHDCPFVVKHYNHGSTIPDLQARAAEEGHVWLQIISSAPGTQGHVSADEAIELNVQRGASPAHVILDESGVIGRAYDARTTPHMFIIDGEGVIQYAGAIDDQPSANPDSLDGALNYVSQALDEMAAGLPVSINETRPYGCSVKYADAES